MKLLWATDIHLDHLRVQGASEAFGEALRQEQEFDAAVITGDITTADHLHLLQQFARGIGAPVYFVLGNHDYYNGSIAKVRAATKAMCDRTENLIWLDRSGPVLLGDTVLVGMGGHADASCGDPYKDSRWMMRDWTVIQDYRKLVSSYDLRDGVRRPIVEKAKRLGQAAARMARGPLEQACKLRKEVVFATHYPPFRGACVHEGSISDDTWAPWFTSVAMGKMLEAVAEAHPDNRITVLCGHTHSKGLYKHSHNLFVFTGAARYGVPDVSEVFELPISWSSARYGWE